MFKPTPAGERRRRVQLLSRTSDTDEFGQATQWAPYLTVWAKIDALTGSEKLFGQSEYASQVDHRVNIRYQPSTAIRARDRVLYNGRTFEIKAVLNPEERNIELDLLCLEIDDGSARGA